MNKVQQADRQAFQRADARLQAGDHSFDVRVHPDLSRACVDSDIGEGVAAGGNVGGGVCWPDLNGEAAQPEAAE